MTKQRPTKLVNTKDFEADFRAQFQALVAAFERESVHEHYGPNSSRRLTFSVAPHRGSLQWFTLTTNWAVLLTLLNSGIVTKVKDSIMLCPGLLAGGTSPAGTRKIKANVEGLYFVTLDFDKGDAPLPVLEARMRELNLECAMWATYSDGKDKTELAWSIRRPNVKTGVMETEPSAFQLYARKAMNQAEVQPDQVPPEVAKLFMVDMLQFGPDVLGGMSILSTDRTESEIVTRSDGQSHEVTTHNIVVGHNPIAKTRLMLPLASPVMRGPNESKEDYQKRWREEVYNPVGRLVGFHFDEACSSTERGHYAMTVKEGATENPRKWVAGRFLDLEDPGIAEALGSLRNANSETDASTDTGEDSQTETKHKANSENCGAGWLGFMAADAAFDHLSDVTDKRSDDQNPLVAFPCPFVHEHATSNTPGAHQCYAYNAKHADKHPTVKCQSDTCKDRPYREFLEALFNEAVKADPKYRIAPRAKRTGVFVHRDELESVLHEINETWAVVRVGNRTRFLHQTIDGNIELYDLKSITAWFSNWFYFWPVKGGAIEKAPVLQAWLAWEFRRQYRGMRFCPDPVGTPEDIFNTYFGFTVKPERGCWKRMLGHIYRNICQRNPEYFRFTIAWLAQLVQQPHIKPGTNIVLKGAEGVGKSKLGEWIVRLFGPNAIAVSESARITGQFNGHLENKLFMLGEEAFWAGDKAAEGKLKDLATGTITSYERKGLDAYEAKNYTRLMITSNEDWVVPASSGGRRWFVLEVGEEQKQNHKFFAALDAEMASGGLSAMLHDLLHTRLPETVNVRNAPVTPWLVEQRLHSYDNKRRWWRGVLQEGGFRDNETGSFVELFEDRPTVVKREDIFASARRYFAGPKGVDPTPSEIGQFLAKTLGELGQTRPRSSGRRQWCTILPPLRELRQKWLEQTGEAIDTPAHQEATGDPSSSKCEAKHGEKYDLGRNPFSDFFDNEAAEKAVKNAWEAGIKDFNDLADIANFEAQSRQPH